MKIYGVYTRSGGGYCVECAACIGIEEIIAVEEEDCLECENCNSFPKHATDTNSLDYDLPESILG